MVGVSIVLYRKTPVFSTSRNNKIKKTVKFSMKSFDRRKNYLKNCQKWGKLSGLKRPTIGQFSPFENIAPSEEMKK